PWSRRLRYRAGDGLAALEPADRIDTVVLAGVGGRTIVRILSAPPALPRRLVLQPRTEERALRRWLSERGLVPVAETLTEERGRQHLTLAAEPGPDEELYRYPGLTRDDLLAAGPLLVRAGSETLRRRWAAEADRWKTLRPEGPELRRAERVLAAISRRA
ncbi:MAG TPA: tRNA (adenine(22)-N(1))-methyltransferase TrmK, partial [Candidatus Polarisedimenticolaceae bacterium]|nr:tRNA (adenine(22)-N(1))-methyltransferase TrmK [Candidatus Polarisedimenticolaceae bacterium]